jgi:hypothetical protein
MKRFLFAALASLCLQEAAATCLEYVESQVVGSLVTRTFPGPPNYESITAGDRLESFFFVLLAKPICLSKGKSSLEPALEEVREVQLLLANDKVRVALQPFLGSEVSCTGTPLGAHTGHHHAQLLLENAECAR